MVVMVVLVLMFFLAFIIFSSQNLRPGRPLQTHQEVGELRVVVTEATSF